ncbi:Serine_incorporator protein [Hexamita inflata]|uniref:Serine_incorporator protein n=1 Tax=Hexamita inflata TaxID=28002 RepID=A0ABP1GGG6_9EUKA
MVCCIPRGCCRSVSMCHMKFNRIFYVFMLLIPIICNIVFMFHPEYFNNKFWSGFAAYKEFGYDYVWIMNIRFVFTYFVYHIVLLAFSLFQTCGTLAVVAKFVHRGLLFLKLPFLVGFFFLTFVFPNKSMLNFQYLMIVLGGIFQFFLMLSVTELGYVWFNKLKDSALPIRIIVFTLMIVFFGLGVTEFVFAFLNSSNVNVTVMTAICVALSAIAFILALVAKHASSFPVSFVVLLSGLSCVYGSNLDFTYYNIFKGKYSFNHDCYYALASIAAVLCLLAVFVLNVMELSIKPLFVGQDPRGNPEFGPMVSMDCDDDTRSDQTSYYYWAFHLVAIGAICYIGNFTVAPITKEMQLTHWYSTTLSSSLYTVLLIWTEFLPMLGGRSFM